MFVAPHAIGFLDDLRVPYAADAAAGHLSPPSLVTIAAAEGSLSWPSPQRSPSLRTLGEIRIYAGVMPDDELQPLLQGPGRWHRRAELLDAAGESAGSIWGDSAGRIVLPFDPNEAIRSLLAESYQAVESAATVRAMRQLALRSYYLARPVLPRRLQIAMRRLFSRLRRRTTFPRWPIEPSLHDLYGYLLELLAEAAGERVPWLRPWPRGRSWTLVLTHDVETAFGRDNVNLMRDLERRLGFRSSWNFVPRRYEVSHELVEELSTDGFEVGVHGLYHDGRDLASRSLLEERLPEICAYRDLWGATGFRSPATHRGWELMPLLPFDYDSSYPDSDPFEPQGGGCCSWLPFFNEHLVELPITLVQDHTLFVILGEADERLWLEKARYLRDRGGMALLITHPDYMTDPARLSAYERFLSAFGDDEKLWRALPREISDWWRRRAASAIVRDGSGWRVDGPAADAADIAFADPLRSRHAA